MKTRDDIPTVTLVGAGPGDPELLTIKAVKALRRASLALVDDLVHPDVLRHLRRGARVVHVGKRGGCPSTPQAFIHRLMVAEAQRGERVVRIKGGDPFVFGRGGEECEALRAAGIAVEVISGLTAGIAAPAAIGIPVTDRRWTRGVALVTGHAGTEEGEPDWAALARSGLTLVIYMGVARLPAITAALRAAGLAGDKPAAVVCHAHTPAQRQAVCTLDSLVETVAREGLASPAIVVIGDVVQAAPAWGGVAVAALDSVRAAPAHYGTTPGRSSAWASTS
ncbi:Uroporphyrinogen-III C-methyltransferase [Rubrivivax sp. A210]|uniref:uroporphyrinogen-III C-methyltransferase n=1 Tax=Rubrivivax sp. A210 TaxID=2772301 RepID=UPI001919F6F9|nr:uroporphyrinogen-III C-methyltransferase [Rubrivivax sp. A210]CAD5370563.1 Uroporphyrinogen-III C-methyltransferase [Rubrivivax sp. A210]